MALDIYKGPLQDELQIGDKRQKGSSEQLAKDGGSRDPEGRGSQALPLLTLLKTNIEIIHLFADCRGVFLVSS